MAITRRDFLVTSATTAGGLVLGMYLPGVVKEVHAAGTVHAPNAWVRIADNNTITLITQFSEMGQGVYTSMPMLLAEELEVDLRKVKVENAPVGETYKNALLGAQLTGGSTSVRAAWEQMRTSGAQVRMMLITAAANQWKVSPDKCRAENGVVIGPGGKKATYGQLAAEAAKLPVPQKVELKDPKDFKIIGKPTRRLDTPPKVNGTAEFGMDVRLPGLMYASLEQCPVIGGKVKKFDASNARKMPGVVDVVQVSDGVAVVADTYWHAKKAREALLVEWDEGQGARLSTASMWEGIRNAAASGEKIHSLNRKGDPAAALQGAAKVLKAEYQVPLLAHAAMEPMNFVASYRDGKCELIGPTQFQQGAQGAVAAALDIKPENVTVRTTFLGGGFGRRVEIDYAVQAAEISRASGRPVKLVWTREDDTTHDFYRPMGFHRMQGGLDASGKPVALTFQLTSQSVTQRAFGLPKDKVDPFVVEYAVVPYEIPNMAQDLVQHDAGLRVGYWRSVSHVMNCFANECFMDEMAAAAGQDPYRFRMALLDTQPRYANVMKLAADKAGWGKPLPTGRFHGIALMEGYGTYMAEIAEISVSKDNEIRVHKVTVAADLGRMVNPDTVRAQIESSIVYGLSAALYGEITLENGRIQQTNFHDYPSLRMHESPQVDIILVESTEKPGGIGEPATALIAPAVANAVFVATGKRLRKLPLTPESIAKA